MHAFLLPSPFFPLPLSLLLSINLHCWSSLVNTDLEQLPLHRRHPRIAYMMSMKGKVKVTSSTVMKTYAAQVQ